MNTLFNNLIIHILLFVGAMSLPLFSGCSTINSEIAAMRGGKIRVDDFYQAAFFNPTLGSSFSSYQK